jgi:hypothetical protein
MIIEEAADWLELLSLVPIGAFGDAATDHQKLLRVSTKSPKK